MKTGQLLQRALAKSMDEKSPNFATETSATERKITVDTEFNSDGEAFILRFTFRTAMEMNGSTPTAVYEETVEKFTDKKRVMSVKSPTRIFLAKMKLDDESMKDICDVLTMMESKISFKIKHLENFAERQAQSENGDMVAPRGRGRPRKEVVVSSEPKRPRGRPRKEVSMISLAEMNQA